MVHHIGVGDVFVIAGQSNAAGRAKNPVDDEPELGVHLLRPSGRWDLATHPLGETTGAVHLGHYENHNPGHSPWLHFAKRLRRELGYPIGLVPCAYGGAPLRWWNPEENGALTANMLAMLADYDLHPKAVLWYQGEAEGYENSAGTYLARFTATVEQIRRALGQPELPFLTVQLNRCVEGPTGGPAAGHVRHPPCDGGARRRPGAVRLYPQLRREQPGGGRAVRPGRPGRVLRPEDRLDGPRSRPGTADRAGYPYGALSQHALISAQLRHSRRPAAL